MASYGKQIIEACKRKGFDIFEYGTNDSRRRIGQRTDLVSGKCYTLIPEPTPMNPHPTQLTRGPFMKIETERRALVGFEPQLEDKPCAYVRIMFSSPTDIFPIRQFIKGLETLSEK